MQRGARVAAALLKERDPEQKVRKKGRDQRKEGKYKRKKCPNFYLFCNPPPPPTKTMKIVYALNVATQLLCADTLKKNIA